MNKIFVTGLVIFLIILIGFSGCLESENDEESYSDPIVFKQDETLAETGGNWVNFTVVYASKYATWNDMRFKIDCENSSLKYWKTIRVEFEHEYNNTNNTYYIKSLNSTEEALSILGDHEAGIIFDTNEHVTKGDKLILHDTNLTIGYKYSFQVIHLPSSSYIFEMKFE